MTATLTLSAEEAQYLVRAVLPAVSKDDVTPVITGVLFSLTAEGTQLLATDRYRVHRARSSAIADVPGEFLVPAPVLRWLIRNVSLWGRQVLVGASQVTFVFESSEAVVEDFWSPLGTVSVTVSEADGGYSDSVTYAGHLIKGRFPPVGQLFDKARAAERAVDSDPKLKLSYLTATQNLARQRDETPRIKWAKNDNSSKPGPVLVEFTHGEALVQPNLEF